ncbi:MAG: hypothetical protein NUV75_00645 [Gallionella sp.]|nr:hypothetical protein [Gallionella sp.]
MIDLGWKVWAALAAALITANAGLWFFGVFPWWVILLAAPAEVVLVGCALMIGDLIAWKAAGWH